METANPFAGTLPLGQKLTGLKKLASDPAFALEIGKAAEHLVCADLIIQGYRAFLSDQGLPYDAVVDINGRLIRLQIKAACFPRNVNAAGKNERIAYNFSVRRRGKEGQSRLTNSDCDIVALVALDIKTIAYFPIGVCASTVQLPPPGYISNVRSDYGWESIDQFPFASALSNDASLYERLKKASRYNCANGHEMTETNSFYARDGRRRCLTCAKDRQHRYNATEVSHVS